MVQPDFREPAGFTDPPDKPDCLVCDDVGTVEVATITDRDGHPVDWPTSKVAPVPEVDCPWCAR